ncbi:Nucleoporin Nup37 [Hypsizygus marmoreus]|uniref:Nucleoporin Nup37 n=1 Tax=Hypsizygus marmoreus TaxID=39966 RepID=A0A369JZ98_HYPMA|nr:Nucleoporin Nup37 [Hypsizygus marmoreus]
MDLQYNHGAQVYVLRACYNDDATDLLAVAGDHSLDVLIVADNACRLIASFHIGSRVTAIAWSPLTVSPTLSDDWHIELAVAGADFGLHLLTKSATEDEFIFPFGGGLSGHHGKVNDMTFCGGRGDDSTRYVATVSDDKMLMVWDLRPTVDITSRGPSPGRPTPLHETPSPSARPQPTAYVIAFPHPLTTISSHPSTGKEFLVSDSRGSIFMTDWRSDPQDNSQSDWRHSSLIELVEPYALSDASLGRTAQWSGSVAWRRDTTDIIGAVYGSRFSVWDISNLRGGKPSASGISFPEGGHQFRWCPTYPDYFAISTKSPSKGAVIHVHNINYIQAQPTVFNILPRPHLVRDLDFLALPGIPRIAAAIGRTVMIFSIGVDS